MALLEGKGKSRTVGKSSETEPVSKCRLCEYYQACLLEAGFDEDSFDGCLDFVLKKSKESIVEKENA